MSNYKYIVLSDLDGTLLNEKGVLSQNTVEFVRKLHERGDVLFAYSTGRSWLESKYLYDKLQLKGFVSCNNGAYIYNPHTGHLNCFFIAERIWKAILKNEEFLSGIQTLHLYSNKGEFIFGVSNLNSVMQEIEEEQANICVAKFIFKKSSEIIGSKVAYLKTFDIKPTVTIFWQPDTVSLEISADFASKEFAVRYFANFYGISYDNILTFGDQVNDLSAIEGLSRSIAVANAVDIIKQKAKKVSRYTNDEDSVIKEIDEFLNSKAI